MDISDHRLTFSGAGSQSIQTRGRYLRIREASGPVYLSFNGSNEIKRNRGEQINTGEDNRRVEIRSAIAQVIELTTSMHPQDDNRTAVSMTTTTTLDASNNAADQPAVTVPPLSSAQIATGSASRIEIEISVGSDAAGGVWVGGSTISALRGSFIEPGMSKIYASESEWWAYNPNPDAVIVQVLELERI